MPFVACLYHEKFHTNNVYTHTLLKTNKGRCQEDSIQCKRDYPETGSLKMRAEQNAPNIFSISDV